MLIVGSNLRTLMIQYGIVDDERAFDETSLTLRLDRRIMRLEPPPGSTVTYGNRIPGEWLREDEIPDSGHVLAPHSCVLACSFERVSIPLGYFGLIQTKGSLARLFVAVQCGDGQVDCGFSGKVTFEICNLANFAIVLLPKQDVAQLFIFKTSTKQVRAYAGRYQSATGPTAQRSDK